MCMIVVYNLHTNDSPRTYLKLGALLHNLNKTAFHHASIAISSVEKWFLSSANHLSDLAVTKRFVVWIETGQERKNGVTNHPRVDRLVRVAAFKFFWTLVRAATQERDRSV